MVCGNPARTRKPCYWEIYQGYCYWGDEDKTVSLMVFSDQMKFLHRPILFIHHPKTHHIELKSLLYLTSHNSYNLQMLFSDTQLLNLSG